jgi:TetR/AcrR family transcriptional repressor of mexJK operon
MLSLSCPLLDAVPAANASPKQQAVLKAASTLFLTQGYAAVSMEAVAREAGVSKATLYAHFTGKDALFAAIVAEGCSRMVAAAEGVSTHALPLREAVMRLGDFWLSLMLSPQALAVHRIVLAEGHRFPDLAEAFFAAGPARAHGWVAGWIAEEQRLGRLRAEAVPAEAAWQLVSLLRAEVYLKAALGIGPAPDGAAVARTVASAAEAFLRIYAAPGEV